MSTTRARGDAVERAARAHLLAAGLREVAANANFRFGELDLVMLDESGLDESGRDGATVVFVEVRYRRSSAFGGGAVSVTAGKRRRIVRAAQAFLLGHRGLANAPCRFDVIEADGDPAAPRLNWIRDAFRADDP
ncbi:YraN family protein [Luteimonas sp. R10]|uniref:YraN family protein n=1 Tax=Luteimonas sp. R10 TaxID=3108176 RepID=UPI00308F8D39|nr:YraN family protein [Luteimonas sp. R10]